MATFATLKSNFFQIPILIDQIIQNILYEYHTNLLIIKYPQSQGYVKPAHHWCNTQFNNFQVHFTKLLI